MYRHHGRAPIFIAPFILNLFSLDLSHLHLVLVSYHYHACNIAIQMIYLCCFSLKNNAFNHMSNAAKLSKIKLIPFSEDIERQIKKKKRVFTIDGRLSPLLSRFFSYLPLSFIQGLTYGACVELNKAYYLAAGQVKIERGYTRDEHLKWSYLLSKGGMRKKMHEHLHPWLLYNAHHVQHIGSFYRCVEYLFLFHLSDHSLNTYEVRELTGTTSVFITIAKLRKAGLIAISGKVNIITTEGPKRVTSYVLTDNGVKLVNLALDFLERKENGLRASLKKLSPNQ